MFSYHPLKMMPSLLGCGGLPEAIGKRMHDMAVVALAETLRNEDAYAKFIRFLGKFHSTQPPKSFPEFLVAGKIWDIPWDGIGMGPGGGHTVPTKRYGMGF